MDDTKKALLSIDIDTAALTQNAANAKAAVAALADQLKELKTAGKDSGEAFDKIVEQLKKAGEEAKKSNDSLKEYSKGLSESAKAVGDLSAAQQKSAQDNANGAASLAVLQQRYSASKNEVAALKTEFQLLTQHSITLKETHEKNSIAVKTMQGNLLALSARVKTAKANSLEYKNAIDALGDSQQKADHHNVKTTTSVAEFTDRIVAGGKAILPFGDGISKVAGQFNSFKEGASKAIDGVSNIGKSFTDYQAKVKALATEQNNLKGNVGTFAQSFQTLKSGFEVATGGANNFGKALLGTGIGAVIVAVGVLMDVFKKFQPAVDLVDQAMAGFNGAIDAAKHMVEAFVSDIKSVGDLFSKLGNFIAHPIDSLTNLGKALGNAAIKTAELKKAQQDLDGQIQASVVKNAEIEAQIADLRVKSQTANLAQRKEIQAKIKQLQEHETTVHRQQVEEQVRISVNKVAATAGLTQKEIGDISKLDSAKIQSLALSKHLNAEEVKALQDAVKQMADLRKEESEKILKNFSEHETLQQVHYEKSSKATVAKHKEKKQQATLETAEIGAINTAGNNNTLSSVTETALKAAGVQFKADDAVQQKKKKNFKEITQLLKEEASHYQQHFGKLAGLFAKNTAAGKAAFEAQKAMAVAKIAINTEEQISESISATKGRVKNDQSVGYPFSLVLQAIDIALGVADVASIIQNSAKQVSSINSTNVQGFARGGLYQSDGYGTYLTGPGSGTSDSINAKLSNGESIINARSTQMFAPILSAINQAGGDRAFNTANPGNGYAQGGLFNGSNTLNDGYSDLANTRALNDMAKTMAANMPRQILVVEDVQASLQNKAMLQSMSNF